MNAMDEKAQKQLKKLITKYGVRGVSGRIAKQLCDEAEFMGDGHQDRDTFSYIEKRLCVAKMAQELQNCAIRNRI